MLYTLLAPFFIQAVLIFFDEIIFHVRRGLPKWERIGHPIDTLSFILCIILVQVFPCSSGMLLWYVVLALASCLLITKDEFVHKHHCCAKEQWLHAVLFINHPILLTSIALLWYATSSSSPPTLLTNVAKNKEVINFFLKSQTIFTSIFMLYQIIYWNFLWKLQKSK